MKPLHKGMNQNKSARRGRKHFWPESENFLKILVMNKRNDGKNVSTLSMKFKAKIIKQKKVNSRF